MWLSIIVVCGIAGAVQANQSFLDEILPETLIPQIASTAMDTAAIPSKMAKMQIPFIANTGQVDAQVAFYANTFGGTVFVTEKGEIVYTLPNTAEEDTIAGVSLKETFVGGTVRNINGEEQVVTRVNSFKGDDPSTWQSNIPTYALVNLGEVYRGIEVTLKAQGNNVEKLFVVHPKARPEDIRLKLSGTREMIVNDAGELEVETALGSVSFTKPVAYQEDVGGKEYVDVAYVVQNDEYGFEVGAYDYERPLIIDPLLASTFLGSSNWDYPSHMTFDSNGNIYVTGMVATSSFDFPTTVGAYDTTYNGDYDIFISKLNSDLSMLLASTYLGGSFHDYVRSMTIDDSNNIYVTGYAVSPNFPTTAGAYDTIYNEGGEVFVSKLSGDLKTLIASTFLKESGRGRSVTINDNGSIYVTGYTSSPEFPTTAGAYDTTHNGNDDVFISRLSSDLSLLEASTFLGGSGDDMGFSLTVDENGDIYITGRTNSTDKGYNSIGFPTTAGAYNTTYSSRSDVFVAKLSSNLSTLTASTVLGGDYGETGSAIIEKNGDIYITGNTKSPNFPTTEGAYNTTLNGSQDAFVSRLNSDLTTLIASTLLGGSRLESGVSLTIDSTGGSVYVTGGTTSSDFPTTAGAYDTTHDSGGDAFVAKLDSNLSTLTASTLLGNGSGSSIAIDKHDHIYVFGSAYSADILTTAGGYDATHNGGQDIFVSKLDQDLSVDPSISITSNAGAGGSIVPFGNVPVSYGADQPFTITPDACHHVSELLIDGVPDPSYQGASETFIYTFEDVITDHTIQANFQQTPGTITASTGPGGSISPEGIVGVPCGEDQSFTMTPDPGYDLDELLVDGIPDSNYQEATGTFIYTFGNVITDHTIEASFQQEPEMFAISGHVRTTSGEGIEGVLLNGFPENVTTDSSGYYMVTGILEGWSRTVTPQKEGYTFDPPSRTYTNVMADQSDQDYIGSLTPVTHNTITATAGPGGSITPSGIVSVNGGENQSFAITADDGYEIEDVVVDGVSKGPILTYPFTNVSSDHTIEASFKIVSGPDPTPTPPLVPTATPPSQPIPEPTTGILLGLGLAGLLILYFKKRKH